MDVTSQRLIGRMAIMIDKSGKLINSYNFGEATLTEVPLSVKSGAGIHNSYSRSINGDMISNQGRKRYFFDLFSRPRSNLKPLVWEGQDFAYDILTQSDGGVTVVGESFSKKISTSKIIREKVIFLWSDGTKYNRLCNSQN